MTFVSLHPGSQLDLVPELVLPLTIPGTFGSSLIPLGLKSFL